MSWQLGPSERRTAQTLKSVSDCTCNSPIAVGTFQRQWITLKNRSRCCFLYSLYLIKGKYVSLSIVEVEFEVKLRPTISLPVCLSVSVWQLRVSCCGAPSLTRRWLYNLPVQLFLGFARVVTLGSKSRRTQTIFYCLILDSLNLEGQIPVFISPRNRVAQLYSRALGSLFIASYNS
jgi:hypothetical protein